MVGFEGNGKKKSLKVFSLIVISLFLCLFVSGTVSALDWSGIDNYKIFQDEGDYLTNKVSYGTIEVWDTATKILFQADDRKLVEYKLIDNTDYCITDCYAEGTVKFYESGKLFEEMNFYDLKNNKKNIPYKLYLWQENIIEVEETIFEEVCYIDFNGTVCIEEENGTITKEFDNGEWLEYDLKNLNIGEYRWRLEGNKRAEENIDWIGSTFGLELDEWAIWGGTITEDGDYTVHTYSTVGSYTFNVSDESTLEVEVLIVAGGGGGGGSDGAGGGAGGLIHTYFNLTNGIYNVTVGDGGAGGSTSIQPVSGGNSIFNSTTASGGGGGYSNGANPVNPDGGSGGGADDANIPGLGIVGQGYDGGGQTGWSGAYGCGGGGGASEEGFDGTTTGGGNGGDGSAYSINGTSVTYAGGGGGGRYLSGTLGIGGAGGGGDAGGQAGTNGLGGGGGGSYGSGEGSGSGSGGSGIVIIRYLTPIEDEEYPQFSNYKENPANNTTYSLGATYEFNTTIIQTNGTVGLDFNSVNYTAFNSTGTIFNATITDLPAGTYSYYWWAYGNGTNTNYNTSETRYYTIAKASSVVYTYLNDSRSDITIQNNTAIWLNSTLITGDVGATLTLYNNGTVINSGTSPLSNLTAFNATGMFNITTIYTSSENYTVGSETWWVNVTAIDTTPPSFIDGTPTNQTITYGDAFAYNINATDEIALDCFIVNDTTNFKINCSGYLENNTLLSAGLYNLNVTINDTSNNKNSGFFWVNVTKANPSLNMAITGTTPIEYGITSDFSESETNTGDGGCSYSMDRGNEVYGAGTWVFNYSTSGCINYTAGSVTKDLVVDKNTSLALGLTATTPIEYPTITDFVGSNCPTQLSCSLNISNAIYQAGDISANYSTAGNNNYSATSIDFTVTINQNSSYVLGISGTTPIVYGTITDVVGSNCPSQLSCSLDKANDIYGVGVETFNYSNPGNTNYTAGSITKDITITQATPIGSLAGTSPITYGTAGDVEGTESNTGDGDIVYKLYREGIEVSNPDNTVLGVGTYNYIYNSTGGQNYSSTASLDTFALTVDIETGAGTLLLNGSATNYTINRTENVNITATLDTGSGDISVYIDTTLFQTGSSPISDDEQFNTLGWYLINFTYSGNENYTGFEKYLYVNVTANPLAVVSIVYPTSGDYEAHFTQLNYTVLYGTNCWYNLGEGGGYIAITCGDNITGITSVDDSNTWTIKVENLDGFNTTDSVVFTIDLPIDYSTFTLRMVDVLKICIMLSGLFIIIMAAKSFFLGDSSFGRLFFICVVVGLAVLFILLLGPIAINYISTLIK